MTNRADRIRKFYRGVLYPVLVAGLVFAGNASGQDVLFMMLILLSAVPGLFVMHDADFLLAPFIMFTLTVTGRYFDQATGYLGYDRYWETPWSIIGGVVVAVTASALINFLVRNRRGVNRLRLHPVLSSLLILCGVMLFNGIFNPLYTPKNLMYTAFFSMITLLVYVLFAFYGNFDRLCVDRLFFCLTVAGVLIFAELLFAYFTRVSFADGTVVKESVIIGWGVWTHVGGMLAFLMPAPFYFARWHKHGWVFYLLGLVAFAGTLLSQSRGALLVGAVIFLICLILVCSGGPNRRQNRIFTGVLLAALAVGAIILSRRLGVLIQNFIDYGFGDNGRFDLWKTGWAHFLDYPVFGSGFYDACEYDWTVNVLPYFYHDTLVQMLAACGAAGLMAYLWHRAQTVRLVICRRSVPKAFLGTCIFGLLLFSLIDVLFFKLYPTVIYTLILLYMEKSEEPTP